MRPVTVRMSDSLLRLAQDYGATSEIGGRSHIREDQERASELCSDQVIGHLGQMALHLYWHGHLHLYRVGRAMADVYPTIGDGGADMAGANVDVKTSLVRTSRPLEKHHLLVRPAERHTDWIYIQALLDFPDVHLMGWLHDSELDSWMRDDGPFAGAFAVPVDRLHALPPVQYAWTKFRTKQALVV